jgi:hypothetical protein
VEALARWLERAVELGLAKKDGRGHKGYPYRYRLPEREAPWREDPIAAALMPELFTAGDTPAFSPLPRFGGEGLGVRGKETPP